MNRGLIEVLKDEVWKTGVRVKRPLTTLREGVRDLVFDAVGMEVYDAEWDLLVVLDAFRADALRSVQDEYEFLGDMDTAFSKGSSSREWISTNFHERHRNWTKRTAYVTGNPFSNDYLDKNHFNILDEVWRYHWDDEVGTIPPDVMTKRAILVGRNGDHDRMIVHYMQPHFPSIPHPEIGSAVDPETNVWLDSVWDRLESDDISYERVWEAYLDNLRHVLDSVSVLLKNVEAETAILTADHGDGFGEEGIYGHPRLRTHRVLREVPWVMTDATDEETLLPEETDHDNIANEEDIEKRLADLGYR